MNIIKFITPKTVNIDISSCELNFISCDNSTLEINDYYINGDTLTINEKYLNKKIKLSLTSTKQNLIGYSNLNSVYSFYGQSNLKVNSKYILSFSFDNNVKDFTFDTELTPLYCKSRDVKTLISTLLNNTKEDIDLDYEIFIVSQEVSEDILNNDNLVDGYSESTLKKLTANMAAYNIVYRYYYSFLDEVGSLETAVGTLSEKRSRYALNLNDLLKRFERNIISFEEQLIGVKAGAQTFTKASSSETGLNSRLW